LDNKNILKKILLLMMAKDQSIPDLMWTLAAALVLTGAWLFEFWLFSKCGDRHVLVFVSHGTISFDGDPLGFPGKIVLKRFAISC
jgi:hypothetical protein